MPAGFEWSVIDITNHDQALELYTLLTENYVEDDDCQFRLVYILLNLLDFPLNSVKFRFNYSVAFLQWALSPPGYFPDWILGVRNTKNGKLLGSITGVPATIKVYNTTMLMAEINFLCVHKKLRYCNVINTLYKCILKVYVFFTGISV